MHALEANAKAAEDKERVQSIVAVRDACVVVFSLPFMYSFSVSLSSSSSSLFTSS